MIEGMLNLETHILAHALQGGLTASCLTWILLPARSSRQPASSTKSLRWRGTAASAARYWFR